MVQPCRTATGLRTGFCLHPNSAAKAVAVHDLRELV